MRPWEWRTLAQLLAHSPVPRGDRARGKQDRFVYPHVLRYRRHAEFGCHSLIPGTTFEELARGFDEARALGGDFCIATHYWEVDRPMHDVLRADRWTTWRGFPDVRFVAAEELFA